MKLNHLKHAGTRKVLNSTFTGRRTQRGLNLLSYFTEQSGWMLSVGLLVVHGTLLVDVIPHLLS